MNRVVVIGIIFLFIASSVIPISGLNLKQPTIQTSSGNILYVGGSGPGNYTKIQDAIDDASDGDTVFVYDNSSPYYENVEIDKSINLIGEDKETTIINAGGSGDVIYVSASEVYISGFTIQNSGPEWGDGGMIIRSNYTTITNIITSNNWFGIYLRFSSNNNTITSNTISNNNYGIRLWDSSNNNTITSNTISNNNYGIRLWDSSDNNTITSNTISNNNYGIKLSYSSDNTIIKNNFIDNEQDAYFRITTLSRNRWKQNYWNRPRIFPKLVFGEIEIIEGIFYIPWFNIDWRPALKPYDIPEV